MIKRSIFFSFETSQLLEAATKPLHSTYQFPEFQCTNVT